MSNVAAARQTRRSDIINLTVTEIMLLMVFVILVFSFLAREEELKPVASYIQENAQLRQALEAMKLEVVDLKRQVAELQADNKRKDETINRLLGRDSASISVEVVPTVDMQKLRADLAVAQDRIKQLELLLAAQQNDLAGRDAKIASLGGGTGYPRCLVTSAYLVEITPLADGGFRVIPAWDTGAERSALEVQGVRALTETSHITAAQFQQFSGEVFAWSRMQKPECRFHARTRVVETSDVPTLLEQQKAIQRVFYWRPPG
jgi:hypothetical protein